MDDGSRWGPTTFQCRQNCRLFVSLVLEYWGYNILARNSSLHWKYPERMQNITGVSEFQL
jgi:hypothetical protein